jgi:hypothetical protein
MQRMVEQWNGENNLITFFQQIILANRQ